MDMENARDDTESSQQRSPGDQQCGSVCLDSKDINLRNNELNDEEKCDTSSCTSETQILWSTGMLAEPIPNGFYSIVADKKFKELYKAIPAINDLHALETNGLKVDIILVDTEKDRKLSKLKQYTVALVKGLNGNPSAIIKNIAGLVSDVYKRTNLDLSPKKATREAALPLSENGGVQLLGQMKHGSCRPRAILFKVLADALGVESRLVVGVPTDGYLECVDSYKHMSVLVVLNSVELLVDLMRVPGQLIPRSSKAIYRSHISAAGVSDSADYDSCDIPMEPNSPLYEISESVEAQRAVRAMNESMKQNRPLHEHEDSFSESLGSNAQHSTGQTKERQHSSQQAVSSFSYEHASQRPQGSGIHVVTKEMVSTWNKVLGLPIFQNKPLVPFEEWNIDFSELTVGTRIGIGFFGEVFRGVWNGTEVAIKVFLEQDLTAENMEDFCNEISILSRLRHPNVILFLGACMKPPRLSLITEYIEMGSLYYLIHFSGQKNKLSWRRRIKMLRDICRGLMCIHRMKIIHHDLKSANCLVSKHWTVKICDFGLSSIMTDASIKSSSGGTPEWMAPEVIRKEPFTEKCDIFSLGVIIWELYTLNRPWDGMPPERVVHAVANEGLRLEMPQGPVGRLIAGMSYVEDPRASAMQELRTILCASWFAGEYKHSACTLCAYVERE